MPVTITERAVGDVGILDVAGRLTVEEGSRQLSAYVEKLLDRERLKILVNLEQVPYLDTTGVAELVLSYTWAQRQGGTLKLLNLAPYAERLLKISHLLIIFETFTAESDALRSFNDTARPPAIGT